MLRYKNSLESYMEVKRRKDENTIVLLRNFYSAKGYYTEYSRKKPKKHGPTCRTCIRYQHLLDTYQTPKPF